MAIGQTVAGVVFAKATTQTIAAIAAEYNGTRFVGGYVFQDSSVVRVDRFSIGYCASDKYLVNVD